MTTHSVCIGIRMGKTVNSSANIRSKTGYSVLVTVTGAAGFVGTHISAILKRHDHCVLGTRQVLLEKSGIFIVEGDINDTVLLNKLFDVVHFTHVMHLAIKLVLDTQCRVPFSEKDRTDQPMSLYIATKKVGEEIAHMYNHIYWLSLTGLRFFTVYGPWGRPDMADFFFTKDILKRKFREYFACTCFGEVIESESETLCDEVA
ncbi:putative UDP-glucuronate 4-epimerase [Helianthus annuus]|nr:putative UDP-glucuronate 4-epimerase [Helianthus annuus]